MPDEYDIAPNPQGMVISSPRELGRMESISGESGELQVDDIVFFKKETYRLAKLSYEPRGWDRPSQWVYQFTFGLPRKGQSVYRPAVWNEDLKAWERLEPPAEPPVSKPKKPKLESHSPAARLRAKVSKTVNGYSAYIPEFPGLGVAARTQKILEKRLVSALDFHMAGTLEDVPLMKVLCQLRKALGITQEHVAEAVGVDKLTIALWEDGQETPILDQGVSFAAALGYSLSPVARLTQREPHAVKRVSE
jgi:DNA-binding XRE family transcriptional regulator/predicted RNase H-like HicB family nuclease